MCMPIVGGSYGANLRRHMWILSGLTTLVCCWAEDSITTTTGTPAKEAYCTNESTGSVTFRPPSSIPCLGGGWLMAPPQAEMKLALKGLYIVLWLGAFFSKTSRSQLKLRAGRYQFEGDNVGPA